MYNIIYNVHKKKKTLEQFKQALRRDSSHPRSFNKDPRVLKTHRKRDSLSARPDASVSGVIGLLCESSFRSSICSSVRAPTDKAKQMVRLVTQYDDKKK